MAVVKEWKCAAHGSFDGTHPICPSMGCMSEHVEREFRTPVGISKGLYNRFDAGLRQTADRMGISDWRTARPGEASFAGRGQDAPLGTQVLWGNEVAKHPGMQGRTFAQMSAAAAQPLNVNLPPERARTDPYIRHNNGMRAAATALGLTGRVLPPAEVTGAITEKT